MQAIYRRIGRAKGEAARKRILNVRKEKRKETNRFFRETQALLPFVSERTRAERIARREDWFMGPLAPRRDYKDGYGCVDRKETKGTEIPVRLGSGG